MSKSKKLLPILCGVLVLLIAATVWVITYKPEGEEPKAVATQFLKYDNVDDIVLVDVSNQTGNYTLANGGEGKAVVKDVADTMVNQESARSFFTNCQLIYAVSTVKEGVPEEELAQYGLTEPQATVTLLDANKEGIQFMIGNQSADGENYYMYVTGLDNVYLMDGEFANVFFQSQEAFLQLIFYPSLADENVKEIERIQLTQPEGQGYTLERTHVSEVVDLIYFDMTAPVTITTSRENVEEKLLTPLQELTGDRLVYNGQAQGALEPTVLAEYGLDAPGYTLDLDFKGEHYTVLFGASEDGYTYAMTQGTDLVYAVEDSKLEFLEKSYMDIVGTSVYDRNITTISNITLDIKGNHYSFDVEGEGNALTISSNGKKLVNNTFMDLFTALNAISIEGEIKEASGTPIFSMEVTYRDGSPNETVTLTPIDDRRCAVTVNGLVAFTTYTTTVDKLDNLAQLAVESGEE
ncbi:MAG: DUF4340 domain-containing protein [Eubacteriales bacterium]|jgi:hypothetical protein